MSSLKHCKHICTFLFIVRPARRVRPVAVLVLCPPISPVVRPSVRPVVRLVVVVVRPLSVRAVVRLRYGHVDFVWT